MDELEIWTIKYRETYESEFKKGLRVSTAKNIDENGYVIPWKYYALDNHKLIEFNPKDVFEVLYYNVTFYKLRALDYTK
jgi:hypothetical protein